MKQSKRKREDFPIPSRSAPRRQAPPTAITTKRLENGKICINGLSPQQLKILKSCSLDDPAIVFDWHTDALETAITFINAPPPTAPQKPPFIGTQPHTIESLQHAITAHIARIQSGIQGRMGTVIIAPLSLAQYSEILSNITAFLYDPFFIAMFDTVVGQIPLATIAFVADGKRSTIAERANIAASPPFGRTIFV